MTMTSFLQAVVTFPQVWSGPTVGTIISAFAGVTALFILKEIIGMRKTAGKGRHGLPAGIERYVFRHARRTDGLRR